MSLKLFQMLLNRGVEANAELKQHVDILSKLMNEAYMFSKRRENGLYVSFEAGKFSGPQDLITKNDSDHTQLIAINSYNFVEQWWYAVTEPGYVRNSKGLASKSGKPDPTVHGPLSDGFIPKLKGHLPK